MRLVYIENVYRKFKNYPRKALEEHKRMMLSTCTEKIVRCLFANISKIYIWLLTFMYYVSDNRSFWDFKRKAYHAIVKITLFKMK